MCSWDKYKIVQRNVNYITTVYIHAAVSAFTSACNCAPIVIILALKRLMFNFEFILCLHTIFKFFFFSRSCLLLLF